MREIKLSKIKSLKGEITIPPNKSISHRAVIFASIAHGKSIVRNFLMAEDPISTMNAMKSLGIEIRSKGNYGTELIVYGKGLGNLKEPFDVINCGNSALTIAILRAVFWVTKLSTFYNISKKMFLIILLAFAIK
ncbi:MAG TPA: hypothetical protein HPP56_05130 [Nitrospirae bacterium]|nr:hypothetical protein [Nitrospirota bacterium]